MQKRHRHMFYNGGPARERNLYSRRKEKIKFFLMLVKRRTSLRVLLNITPGEAPAERVKLSGEKKGREGERDRHREKGGGVLRL